MFNWIPLIGNFSPALLVGVLAIFPAFLAGSLFIIRMTRKEDASGLYSWVSPIALGWLLIGSTVLALSFSPIAADFIFDSWVRIGLFLLVSLFLLPITVILLGEYLEGDRDSEYSHYSTGRTIQMASIETALLLVGLLTFLVISMIVIIGTFTLLGSAFGVDTSNFFNPVLLLILALCFAFAASPVYG